MWRPGPSEDCWRDLPGYRLLAQLMRFVRANKFVAEITGKSPSEIEVVEAKAGKGSATLSMAYSGARFGNKARGRRVRDVGSATVRGH
eukprot:Skav202645  [mRNA]  locus=scaffold2784:25612:28216:+ [translate_table: standard]